MVTQEGRFVPNKEGVSTVLAAVAREDRSFVLEHEAKEILRSYGVTTTREMLCQSPEEALTAAEDIAYPVVLKVVSPDIIHKTEMGGVKVGLKSASELREAWKAMEQSILVAQPSAIIRGFLVQSMVGGREVIIGAKRDAQFGPLLMFGLGGIFVEFLKDVSYCLAPLSEAEAREMIRGIKAYPLLAGARGGETIDEQCLIQALVQVSRLMEDFGEIEELDLNPTFVGGAGVVVADARMFVKRGNADG